MAYMWVAILILFPIDPDLLGNNDEYLDALKDISCKIGVANPKTKWDNSWYVSVITVREGWKECWDAPLVGDWERFPPQEACYEWWWTARTVLFHANCLDLPDEVMEQVKLREAIWYLVLDLRRGHWQWSDRRAAMKRLRSLVGKDIYESGQLPTPRPLHVFIYGE